VVVDAEPVVGCNVVVGGRVVVVLVRWVVVFTPVVELELALPTSMPTAGVPTTPGRERK
jgi:hypothetical protein